MNSEALASLQSLNSSANIPASKSLEKGSVGNDSFMSLIMAILAVAQEHREMAKEEMSDLAGTNRESPEIILEKDAKDKDTESTAQEAVAAKALLFGSQNLIQYLSSEGDELSGQQIPALNPECCLSHNIPAGTGSLPVLRADSRFSMVTAAPEDESGQPLAAKDSCQPVSIEISGPTASGHTNVTNESNQISSQGQVFLRGPQVQGVCPDGALNKTGNQPEKLQSSSKEAKATLLQQEALQEKAPGDLQAWEHSRKVSLSKDLIEQKAINGSNEIPLESGQDASKGDTALRGNQQGHIPSESLFQPKLSGEQTDEIVARGIINQIVEQAHFFVGKKVASLKLQLKPELLGNLKLTISVEDGMVHARFTTDNAAVANLIEARLPELKHALSERGISWHQLSVSVDTQGQSGGFAHPRHDGTGYQQLYPHAFPDEPSAQKGHMEQVAEDYSNGKGVVDYLV